MPRGQRLNGNASFEGVRFLVDCCHRGWNVEEVPERAVDLGLLRVGTDAVDFLQGRV